MVATHVSATGKQVLDAHASAGGQIEHPGDARDKFPFVYHQAVRLGRELVATRLRPRFARVVEPVVDIGIRPPRSVVETGSSPPWPRNWPHRSILAQVANSSNERFDLSDFQL